MAFRAKKKKTKRHREQERCHRILAESCAEAVRHVIRELRVQQTCQQRMRSTGQELLAFQCWKEPLNQTAAWLYYSTLATSVEPSSLASKKHKAGYAKTVATNRGEEEAVDSDMSDSETIANRHGFSCTSDKGEVIPEAVEYDLHVTRNLGHKVVDHLLRDWTTLSKLQISENGRALQSKQHGSYQQALEGMIQVFLREDQRLDEAHDQTDTVTSLPKNEDGNGGNASVGESTQADTPSSNLSDPNHNGQRDTEVQAHQVAYPPAPDAPPASVPPLYTEQSHKSSGETESLYSFVVVDHPAGISVDPAPSNRNDKAELDHTETAESIGKSEAEPGDTSILEGLTCEPDGTILGHNGEIIGDLIEGDVEVVSRCRYRCSKEGTILTRLGKACGKARLRVNHTPAPDTTTTDSHIKVSEVATTKSPVAAQGLQLSQLEGLCCEMDGYIKNYDGQIVGKIIEGDAAEFLSKMYFCDDIGNVRDYKKNVVGKCRLLTEAEQTDFSLRKQTHEHSKEWGRTSKSKNTDSKPDRTAAPEVSPNIEESTKHEGSEGQNLAWTLDARKANGQKHDHEGEINRQSGGKAGGYPKSPWTPSVEEVVDSPDEQHVPNSEHNPQASMDNRNGTLAVVDESVESDSETTKNPKSVSFTTSASLQGQRQAIRSQQEKITSTRGRALRRSDEPHDSQNAKSQGSMRGSYNTISSGAARSEPDAVRYSRLSARGTPVPSSAIDPFQDALRRDASRGGSRQRRPSYARSEWADDTYWDPYYAMMRYQPSGNYPPPSSYYGYPPTTHITESMSQHSTPAVNTEIAGLKEQVRLQAEILRQQAAAQSEEQEDARRQKLGEEKKHEEEKRQRELKQIELLLEEQQRKSELIEQNANDRVSAAYEAASDANRKFERLQQETEDALAEQERTIADAKSRIATSNEQASKARHEAEVHKLALEKARREAEIEKAGLLADWSEKLKAETDAKVAAEMARSSAEQKVREAQRSQYEGYATSQAANYRIPWWQAAQPSDQELEPVLSEDSDSDTEPETTMSGLKPFPDDTSLRRIRVRQQDLDSSPFHKIIFPLRPGWKEHEAKGITKSLARFGYQPIFEEGEAPCVPSQFYEMPGAGGCSLRGTALWQPPGPNLASELYTSFLKCGWKPSYVRMNGKSFDALKMANNILTLARVWRDLVSRSPTNPCHHVHDQLCSSGIN